MKPTFVIGDVHGHYDRLVALLEKAGIIGDWDGTNANAEVVQVGDLGHFGLDTIEGDTRCYELMTRIGAVVLWGNHEYALAFPEQHGFYGMYEAPGALSMISRAKPRFAHAAHGYLITHAGLAAHYAPAVKGLTLDEMVSAINGAVGSYVVDAISPYRGGFDEAGGVLWRDAREPLLDIPQVFGHSRGMIRQYGQSVCIDVAEKGEVGNLAGIWLPERRIVAVGPEADIHEVPLED